MTRDKTKTSTKSICALVAFCMVFAQVVTPGLVQASAEDDLKQIQYKYYFRGHYEQTIDALRTFLARTNLEKGVAVKAREFLAASLILSGSAVAGKEEFLKLLNANEGYPGPDAAVFKADVVSAYNAAREEYGAARLRMTPDLEAGAAQPMAEEGSKPIYKKWWFYAGLGAALLIIAGAASSKGEEDAPTDTGTVNIGVNIR